MSHRPYGFAMRSNGGGDLSWFARVADVGRPIHRMKNVCSTWFTVSLPDLAVLKLFQSRRSALLASQVENDLTPGRRQRT